jgi:hypothetical protein
MDWLKTIAPTIATAIAGPFGGMAYEMIATQLGIEAKEVQKTLDSGKLTGDQIAAIQQAEIALKARAQELGLDFEKVAAADRDSARGMQVATQSRIPPTLAILIVLAWAAIQGFLLTNVIDTSMRELIIRMLGTLDGALILVLSFYFGSSAGSQAKTEILSKAAK